MATLKLPKKPGPEEMMGGAMPMGPMPMTKKATGPDNKLPPRVRHRNGFRGMKG